MHGMPIRLRDHIDNAGLKTTAAAGVFNDHVPAEDAEVTRRLKAAGPVFLDELNLDEMAFAGTGTTGCFGPAHNPWNLDGITGGSSAGSAAVSSGRCFGPVGSDDGGSVRIPGAFCCMVQVLLWARQHEALSPLPTRRIQSARSCRRSKTWPASPRSSARL
jgi:aspartyl-tRNA(Asn)/glutamyl-tRNA(Gln) amidotransferase subunit A